VFFGVPKGATEATFPLVTVSRVGGGDDFSEVPIDIALVQIDCWGGIDDSGNGKKAEAVSLLNAVRNACLAIRGRPPSTVLSMPPASSCSPWSGCPIPPTTARVTR
jgi:hypothetical protein